MNSELENEEDISGMEEPTPCVHCGKWFDLQDGYGSEKWHSNTVICEDCFNEEKKEIENDEEIDEAKTQYEDALFTVRESKDTLHKLNAENPPAKIICLCGSLRFKKLFAEIELKFVLSGWIVLTPCCMYVDAERTDNFMEHKEQFDLMHFKKIELADEIFVINKDGYIGESTQKELNHAKSLKKTINFLEF